MKIIIVDNEQIILSGEVRLVQSCYSEHSVQGFSDCSEALEFLKKEGADVALLDISMPGMSGIEMAVACKMICPLLNIIFVTAYSEYAFDAHQVRASGFLLKPLMERELKEELHNLRFPIANAEEKAIVIKTFGYFQVYVNGKPLDFKSSKSKEMLAYLVDRKGAFVTTKEMAATLWGDKAYSKSISSQLSKYMKYLMEDLSAAGCENLIIKKRSKFCLNREIVECDYYQLLEGDAKAINAFRGEYIANYSWSEFTLGQLLI